MSSSEAEKRICSQNMLLFVFVDAMEWAQRALKDEGKEIKKRRVSAEIMSSSEAEKRICSQNMFGFLVVVQWNGPKRAKKMRVKGPKKGVFLPFTGSCSLYQFPYIIYTYAVSGKFWPHTFYEQDEKACFCRKKAKKSEHFFQKSHKNHQIRIYTALFSGLLGSFFNGFL